VSSPAPNHALDDLAAVLGDDATREIVRLFLDGFPETFQRLGMGARAEQQRIAHGLKSSAMHMGAQQLSDRMAQIEEQLARPGSGLRAADLEGLQADFDAIAPALRSYAVLSEGDFPRT
jgi:HPt (histidine-containing phosphotransfer) domain-containing protein